MKTSTSIRIVDGQKVGSQSFITTSSINFNTKGPIKLHHIPNHTQVNNTTRQTPNSKLVSKQK